jgi:hypothetical protein
MASIGLVTPWYGNDRNIPCGEANFVLVDSPAAPSYGQGHR